MRKGHTVFEVNFEEGTIKPADFESSVIIDKNAIGGHRKIKKVVIKKGCSYINALNVDNVIKKNLINYCR